MTDDFLQYFCNTAEVHSISLNRAKTLFIAHPMLAGWYQLIRANLQKMWRRYCYNWPVQDDAPSFCLIFRVRAIPDFSNNFHIKVWFNKPYYCIVMYTKEWGDRETPPYQGKLGAILSAMMPFRRKMLQLIQEIIILLCLIISMAI